MTFPKRPSALVLSWIVLGLVTLSLGMYALMGASAPLAVGVYVKAAALETPQDPPLPAAPTTLPQSVDALPAWQEYASHIGADLDESHPRIAIVINGLGTDSALTQDALDRMPPEITFAFLPYVADLQKYVDAAREKKHEVLLAIPMEPLGFPRNDPGPYALLTQGGEKNLQRLQWILNHARGYVGVTNYMGSLFTTSTADLEPILAIVREKGLLYLDINESINSLAGELARERGIPTAATGISLHEELNRASIDLRLTQLEAEAKRAGIAIATTNPSPLVFERLLSWAEELKEKGISLVPLSATIPVPGAKPIPVPALKEKEDVDEDDAASEKQEKPALDAPAPVEAKAEPKTEPKQQADHAPKTSS